MKMYPSLRRHRSGTTLVELLLYIAILAVVSVMILPLLFAATEARLLQQTESLVEQNGTQVLQVIARRVQAAERVLDPIRGGTGTVLALQMGSGSLNPTIIGVSSGALVVISHTQKQVITSSQVAIEQFTVRNTSASTTRPSVSISFTMSRAIRLQTPRVYRRTFQLSLLLPPMDRPIGNSCGCALPGCNGANQYSWQVCDNTCLTSSTTLLCSH